MWRVHFVEGPWFGRCLTTRFIARTFHNKSSEATERSLDSPLELEGIMANPRNYYVELRNNSGTTQGTHVYAHSEYEAIQLALVRYPGYRALFARVTS